MPQKKRTKNAVPLIIEQHPEEYNGYPFITLLQYRKQHMLTIVDNWDDRVIRAFVLDLCGPEKVNEEAVINAAVHWWEQTDKQYPISIEFSKVGLTTEVSRIHRVFNVEFVARVIGPLPQFDMSEVYSIKRKKRIDISTFDIHTNVISIF